jgi:hypothetical protein
MKRLRNILGIICLCVMVFYTSPAMGVEEEGADFDLDGPQMAGESENASNPLAAVNNTDVRVQYFDLGDDAERYDFSVFDGSYMVHPKLKLKYELHYWNTDITGSSEKDWESFRLKPIYFAKQGTWSRFKYRVALGFDWIVDFDNADKGIGSGSDQLAPLAGIALANDTGLVLVPLIQHFMEYDGPDVNTTAFRLIGIQSLPNQMWAKLDAKLPVDWENDNEIPATVEMQIGKTFSPAIGAYIDGLLGIGHDRPYDWGVGFGVRFKY